MVTESFKNRLSYMALADMDYLSSRVLVLSGLYLRGNAVFADSLEKQFKLFLILLYKIKYNREISLAELRKYSHNITDLFEEIKTSVQSDGFNIDSKFNASISVFQAERERLYPEKWEIHEIAINLGIQDELYKYFRNLSVANLPSEEVERGKQLGGFLFNSYEPELLNKMYGFTPGTAFKTNNEFIDDFDIDFVHLEKLCTQDTIKPEPEKS